MVNAIILGYLYFTFINPDTHLSGHEKTQRMLGCEGRQDTLSWSDAIRQFNLPLIHDISMTNRLATKSMTDITLCVRHPCLTPCLP